MRKVLVVVDMQNDFVDKAVLGNDECFATIKKIENKLLNNKYDDIVFTQDTHPENYLELREGKKLPVAHCVDGTRGWMVVGELVATAKKNGGRITYITKGTFGSVALGDFIRTMGEDVIVEFVGVCTGICVISNVLLTRAFCPEIELIVDSNCCACVTPETHQTALNAMATCQVTIV